MKKIAWIFIIGILSSFILLILIPQSYSTNQEQITVEYVQRKFSISYNGIITIVDQYTIRNDGLDPTNSIFIGLDEDFSSRLTYLSGIDSKGFNLDLNAIPNIGNGFKQWILYFPNPLSFGMTRNFTITMEFIDLISIYTNNRVNIEFSKYPSSPYIIDEYDQTIYTPHGATTIHNPFTDMDTPPPAYASTEENINPWTEEKLNFYYTFTVGTPMQGYVSVEREIDLNHIGYIQVSEIHSVRNIGPGGMNSLSSPKFSIPNDAKNILIYDNFSQLTYNEELSGAY